VEPGVWLLTASERIDHSSLPSHIAHVGFAEYHVNDRVAYPDLIQSLAPKEYPAGGPVEIRVRVANNVLPDAVNLWIRAAGARSFGQAVPMNRSRANDYVAVLAPNYLLPGLYEYAVSGKTGERIATFPGAERLQPGDWPFHTDSLWSFRVTPADRPIRILDPKQDYPNLSFVRPGEQYRTPFFQIVPGENADESALSLSLPDLGKDTPERYAAALYIGDMVAARQADASRAAALDIKLEAVGGARKTLQVTLIETDGSAWSAPVVAGSAWSTVTVPFADLHLSRSIHIPTPYPGLWDYWRESPRRRRGDRIHMENVERLQLTVGPNSGDQAGDDARGVAVESIRVRFASGA
jgi:hypothetical protein